MEMCVDCHSPFSLQNYRLDFLKDDLLDNRWLGAPATIVPTEGSHVFGAIWEIDMSNLKDLDKYVACTGSA